jgi:hypothetical protein
MAFTSNHRITSADFVEQFIRTMVCHWPGSMRSLVLSLRVGYVMLTTVLVLGLWRVGTWEVPIADTGREQVVIGDDLDEVAVRRHLLIAHFGAVDEVPAGRLMIHVPAVVR